MRLYKISLALFLILVICSPISSADPIVKGLKAGIGISSYQGESGDNTDTRSGFNGGGFVSIPVAENINLQPEILYVMKGVNIPESSDNVKLNYLEVPLLIKAKMPTNGSLFPNLFAGPAFGFLLSAESIFGGKSFDIKDSLKSTDFSLLFGGGFDLKMAAATLVFDIRYTIGLKDIDNMDDLAEGALKNNNFSAMVGLAF